jgi:hypothetical protein
MLYESTTFSDPTAARAPGVKTCEATGRRLFITRFSGQG